MDRSWSLSIVSHGHGPAISQQLRSLSRLPTAAQAELLLTLNLPGEAEPDLGAWPGCVRFLRNAQPQSFAANHNAAARAAAGTYFACLDPDLEWLDDPFPALADWLDQPGQGLAAPCILDEHGRLADHARPPPTPCSVLRRRLGGEDDGLPEPREPQPVPWLAGLFLASRRQTWLQLGGFDERYRLYAEDVELGLRCCVRGLGVSRLPLRAAVHSARRESKTDVRRFYWHLIGLFRLWHGSTWRAYLYHRSRRAKNSQTIT